MKKPSRALWERQARLSHYREVERRREPKRARSPKYSHFVTPSDRIRAPEKFDAVRGSGVEVVKFLRAVSIAVLREKRSVVLDFCRTTTFYPAGTLLMLAEIDRIVSSSELQKPITIRDPMLRRPREVLKQIGLHEITRDFCDVVPQREDVVYWKATKGKDQSGDKLAMLEAVAERVNREHAKQVELSGLWRGVSEAVANSVEHAYLQPRADGFTGLEDTKWWMFTQLRDGIFTVAVCDLGCGYRNTIHRTIPEQFVAKIASLLMLANPDAVAIETAMEYGRSGTRLAERGKGSRDALSVLRGHGNGSMSVLSNTGWVSYRLDGEGVKSERSSLGIDIRGTIIWWKLPLKEPSDGHR